MKSPSTMNEVSNETKVADVIQQEPPPYESINSTNINVVPTQSAAFRRQPEDMQNLMINDLNLSYIDDHLGWSICNILCCFFFLGCVACYFSCETRKSQKQGDLQGALNASRYARNFNCIATILGIISLIVFGTRNFFLVTKKY